MMQIAAETLGGAGEEPSSAAAAKAVADIGPGAEDGSRESQVSSLFLTDANMEADEEEQVKESSSDKVLESE